MRGLLQKEINLEKRVAEARAEREPLSLSDEELLSQFRASSSELEEAKREAEQDVCPPFPQPHVTRFSNGEDAAANLTWSRLPFVALSCPRPPH